jgi:hypothetical protein
VAVALIDSIKGHAAANADGFTTSESMDSTGATILIGATAELIASAGTFSDNKGNTFTPLTQYNTTDRYVRLWYSFGANLVSVGSSHTATIAGTDSWPAIAMAAFSGVGDYESQENGNNTPFGTTVQPGSVTPSDGALLVTAMCRGPHATTNTINSSLTVIEDTSNTDFGHLKVSLAWKEHTSGAINPTWTSPDSAGLSAAIASFVAAGGGGGGGVVGPLADGRLSGGFLANGRLAR